MDFFRGVSQLEHVVLRIMAIYEKHIQRSEMPEEDVLQVAKHIAKQWSIHEEFDMETHDHFERFVLSHLRARIEKKPGLLLFENRVTYSHKEWYLSIKMTIPSEPHYFHQGYFPLDDVMQRNVVIQHFPELQANLFECSQFYRKYESIYSRRRINEVQIEFILPRLTI